MRQFISEEYPNSEGYLVVSGKKYKHLATVLRVAPGDMIFVRLPDATLQQMTVCKVYGTDILLQKTGGALSSTSSEVELWLFQFVAKPTKMDVIIRQATECGVSVIVPVSGAFCQNGAIEAAQKRTGAGDERWSRIITEAREQSGSPLQTRVEPCFTLQKAISLWQKNAASVESLSIILSERNENTLSVYQALSQNIKNKRLQKAAIMVGAEGGISFEELEYAVQNGFKPVHFATNILRCETAALYGLAVLQTALAEKEFFLCNE